MRFAVAAIACVLALASGGIARAQPAGRVAGKITITEADGKRSTGAEAVVYIVGFTEPPAGGEPVKIMQLDKKFVPDLVAITAGDTVSFPNNDGFLHNVFSQSAARRFDLGSFKKGVTKQKDFPVQGVVDVYCNLHPEMAATILVVPNRKHTRIKPDGSYELDGVPPGTWTVFAYTRRATRPSSAKVTVTAGQTSTVDLSLQRGAEPDHLNKYGERYHDAGQTYN